LVRISVGFWATTEVSGRRASSPESRKRFIGT
jgi:hypothetical protein